MTNVYCSNNNTDLEIPANRAESQSRPILSYVEKRVGKSEVIFDPVDWRDKKRLFSGPHPFMNFLHTLTCVCLYCAPVAIVRATEAMRA